MEVCEIKRKDGINYTRKKQRGKETVPSKEQYKDLLRDLTTKKLWDIVLVTRLGCEMGMSRQDIVNAEIKNIDKHHPRSLWIEISKLVRRGKRGGEPNYKMRSREVPVNPDLYGILMNYINRDFKYILKRRRGNIVKPFGVLRINDLYTQGGVKWSPHKSRHYFRTQLKKWMRENQCFDIEVIDALLGHQPRNASEHYGVIDWDYKLEITDKVFE